jgi:hypothetical protein
VPELFERVTRCGAFLNIVYSNVDNDAEAVAAWFHLQVEVHLLSLASPDLFARGSNEVQHRVMALRYLKHVMSF